MWDANESCGMVKAIKDKADADFEVRGGSLHFL